jgi:hypothetical protein
VLAVGRLAQTSDPPLLGEISQQPSFYGTVLTDDLEKQVGFDPGPLGRELMIVRILASALTCLLFSAAGYADSLVPAEYGVNVITDPSGIVSQSGSSAVSLTVGTPSAFPPSSGIEFAQASAAPNYLSVYGISSILPTFAINANYGNFVESVASLSDTFFLANSPATGFLDIGVDILENGILSVDAYIATELLLGAYPFEGNPCAFFSSGTIPSECGSLQDGLNYFLVPYSMSSEDTVEFVETLISTDYCYELVATPEDNSCFAQSSVSAQIASITVDDANGNPVPGATVMALSGVDYTLPQQVATPEPSSFILLGTGIICVVGAMMRRRLSTHMEA